MQKLIECVPNISEGRDRKIIDQVTAVVETCDGVRLLDVDPGADTNRTVITFIGPPEAVGEAAFRVVQTAAQLIDMTKHSGAHPRHGATDVCPFVPVRGATMDDCVAVARAVGQRVGEELGIPVYLYEHAATSAQRRNLADVRKGEYEALADKLGSEAWRPDFGPNVWDAQTARSGATNVGARGFLVAYNVNLNTRYRRLASDIALDVREAGRAKRDAAGKIVRDEDGQKIMVPGTLPAVKAVGWVIPEYDRAQISMNLVDTTVTKPHQAFEEVRAQARRRGLRVTGSELVGLIPEGDLLAAGRHYLEKADQSAGIPRRAIIETAIQSMGLSEISAFDPAEKIIEYQAGLTDGPLVAMSGRDFVDELSSDSPAPGGGSVAALCAAQSAALVAMVANLTVGKKKYAPVQERVKAIACDAQELKDAFLAAIDDDTAAFNAVMASFGLPRKSDAQKRTRGLAIAAATRGATAVPLAVLERIPDLLALADEIAKIGNESSLSDAGVAALTGLAGAEGAYYNVLINLASLADLDQSEQPEFAADVRKRAAAALAACEERGGATRRTVRARLEGDLG
jgi:glutamate formiminotransferase/formiminotetrahydrofolate cyclodeaminase